MPRPSRRGLRDTLRRRAADGQLAYASEEALATLVVERLGTRAGRIVIGGLGMGFALAAARSALPSGATIVVAELVPKVAAWADGPLAPFLGPSLRDPCVTLEIGDVHDVILEEHAAFDAILLDVDDRPDGLISLANDRLYCNWGLRAAHTALRPGGILAVWSAFPDDAFSDRLRSTGFGVEKVNFDTGGSKNEPPHTIWLAARAP